MELFGNKIKSIPFVDTYHFWLEYSNNIIVYINPADIAEEAQKAEGGLLEPFKDIDYFEKAKVAEYGALVWPNGLDMCPDYLFLRGKLVSEDSVPLNQIAS
jgi:hypothetical protein